MAMRTLKIRCPDCGNYFMVRRPIDNLMIAKVIRLVICPHCHPEQSEDVCASCRLPFAIIGKHGKSQCEACFLSMWRYEKKIEIEIKLIIEPEADSVQDSEQKLR